MDESNNSIKNNSTMLYPMFNGQYFVDRILYIKDTIFTLSNGLIKANDINTLKEKSKLNLKTVDYSKLYPTGGVREITPLPDSTNCKIDLKGLFVMRSLFICNHSLVIPTNSIL